MVVEWSLRNDLCLNAIAADLGDVLRSRRVVGDDLSIRSPSGHWSKQCGTNVRGDGDKASHFDCRGR